MMKLLLDVSEAYSILMQEEKQRGIVSSVHIGGESASMHVNTGSVYGSSSRSKGGQENKDKKNFSIQIARRQII